MPGAYTTTTRTTGQVLTASIYNADHQNHIDHLEPAYIDDDSANLAAMQATTDPGEVSSESLATSLDGELQRLRFALKEAKAAIDPSIARWYETPYCETVANVRAYGAVGNGSTDDHVAFQAAIDSGYPVYIPVGSYKIGATLTVTSPTRICGPFGPSLGSTQGALVMRSFDGNLFDIRSTVVMADLLIDDNGAGAGARTGAALYLAANYDGGGNVSNNQAPSSSMFTNVRISSTNGDVEAWQYLVHLDGSGGFAGGTSPPIRRVSFIHCQFFGGRTASKTVYLNRVAHITFLGGLINPAGSVEVGGATVDDANTADVHFTGFEIIGNMVFNTGTGVSYVGGRLGFSNVTTSLTVGSGVQGMACTLILGDISNASPTGFGVLCMNPVRSTARMNNQLEVETRRDNYLRLAGANAGNAPYIITDGSDSNIQLQLRSKGTATIGLNTTSGGGSGGFNSGDGSGTNNFAVNGTGNIYRLGGAALFIVSGSGSPETVVSAGIGSLYCRTDGGASTSLYVKESGSGNTGWIAK